MSSLPSRGTSRYTISGHPGRIALVFVATTLAGVVVVVPMIAVFWFALREGFARYWVNLVSSPSLHAIGLSLGTAAVATLVNSIFGLTGAWAISKFWFRGKRTLVSLIELPLSVSPIILGVAFLFVYGGKGVLGPWLLQHDIILVFNLAAVVIVTTMVTSPLIVRELLPLMESQGTDEEEAAATLGAGGWQIFTRVTLPNIRVALVCGMILCFARAMGEFGSVYIVSGAVRGETTTMTLQIDALYHDYNTSGAFALATVLTLLSLLALGVRTWSEGTERGDAP